MRTRKYEITSMNGFSPGMYAIDEAELLDGTKVGSRRVAVLHDVTKEQAAQTAHSLQAQYDRLAQGV